MIFTSTGMWFFLRMWLNSFQRIGFSLRMNGVQLGFSRAVVGFTMQSIARSPTSCSSGGH